MAMVESHEADFAVFLTWKLTSKAGFAELSLCIREETSPGGGRGRMFTGKLIRAVLLKPFDSDPV